MSGTKNLIMRQNIWMVFSFLIMWVFLARDVSGPPGVSPDELRNDRWQPPGDKPPPLDQPPFPASATIPEIGINITQPPPGFLFPPPRKYYSLSII